MALLELIISMFMWMKLVMQLCKSMSHLRSIWIYFPLDQALVALVVSCLRLKSKTFSNWHLNLLLVGGIHLNITGTGFSENTIVLIDFQICKILSQSLSLIICVLPSTIYYNDNVRLNCWKYFKYKTKVEIVFNFVSSQAMQTYPLM